MSGDGGAQATDCAYKPAPLVQGETEVDHFEQVAVLGTGKSCTYVPREPHRVQRLPALT